VTAVLLATHGLAVFGYCARLVVETTLYFYGIITSALHLTDTTVTVLVVRNAAILLQLFIIWIFSAALLKLYFRPRVQKLAEREIERITELYQREQKRIDHMQSKLDKQFEIVEGALDDAKRKSEEVDEKILQLQQLENKSKKDQSRSAD
jgi:uncharacterized membrane protein